ncbi:MAG: copper resistance protein NlpE [Treponema sp.]|jgi:uncharacterized lipoprotein NlpE involved in copper resistance|nr:copper resistance protein NlpE [Treponema sp.]
MNRKIFIYLFLTALVISGLCSCFSKNSLDWEGVYTGTIPSASGSGINVRMKLNLDQSFELNYEYLDKPDNTFNWTGTFQWDKKESIITLDITDAPSYYKVAQNKLIQLDTNAKPISGKLADNYVLNKEL